MIKFKRIILGNGLRVIVHEDHSTPMVAVNILYNAGSRFENPDRTGLAHLMEHLMFSGSVNIPDFDTPLQLAGGENNAYTNNDIADFYLTIPSENIETAFWLESDRMLLPDISENNLDIQKKVVIEEFKQRYLNQPYGDVMLLLRPAAYERHPYRWPTIGMDISHIEKMRLDDVMDFFRSRYSPGNAILSLAGNVNPEKAIDLVNKWFGDIPRRSFPVPLLPEEPVQKVKRIITAERKVPSDLLIKAWHVCSRSDKDFRVLDLATDILAGGESGRLYEILVRKKKMFSEVNAYLTGDIDPGLLFFSGKLMNGIDIHMAEEEVNKVFYEMRDLLPEDSEMEKVRNCFESNTLMSNVNVLNRAINLSFYEFLDDADLINSEVSNYRMISPSLVTEAVRKYISEDRCTTLYYKSASQK
ncbi:MAG: pitrilysin family protein [Bacteroidales bacterium]|jgi:predicted Zn-dependent peptidase